LLFGDSVERLVASGMTDPRRGAKPGTGESERRRQPPKVVVAPGAGTGLRTGPDERGRGLAQRPVTTS
jgi:hypothetical protein